MKKQNSGIFLAFFCLVADLHPARLPVGPSGQRSRCGGTMRTPQSTTTTTASQGRSLRLGESWTPDYDLLELFWVTSTPNRPANKPPRWGSLSPEIMLWSGLWNRIFRCICTQTKNLLGVAFFSKLSHFDLVLCPSVKKINALHCLQTQRVLILINT